MFLTQSGVFPAVESAPRLQPCRLAVGCGWLPFAVQCAFPCHGQAVVPAREGGAHITKLHAVDIAEIEGVAWEHGPLVGGVWLSSHLGSVGSSMPRNWRSAWVIATRSARALPQLFTESAMRVMLRAVRFSTRSRLICISYTQGPQLLQSSGNCV